ncbi:MAG: DPP IV N-terminal domain-containing protein, partial [Saprospiraceae bacterium]
MIKLYVHLFCLLPVLLFAQSAAITTTATLEPMDVFDLEYVSSPQISPDGKRVIYARNFKDIMTDRNLSNLWIVNVDGSQHQPLTTGNQNDRSPIWTKDQNEIFYLSNQSGKTQIYRHWLNTGAASKLTNLQQSPSSLSLSPDEKWLAFSMNVAAKPSSLIKMPAPPKGAKWAAAPKYIDKMKYRADGSGFVKSQFRQIFILSTDGGTPRQLTDEPVNHGGRLAWSADGKSLLFSANRHADAETVPNNSEIYELTIADGSIKALTDRFGPDSNPTISPDGKLVAYTGLDDKFLGFQQAALYVMNRDGSNQRLISKKLDRSVSNAQWGDNKTLYFQYDDEGDTKIASIDLQGNMLDLTDGVGGMTLGRPYSAGTFSIAKDGTYAYTHVTPLQPADLAIGGDGRNNKKLTSLNDDLFSYKTLGEVEEIWYKSSADGQKIQGWIVKPPNFDASKKYPLMLEIHGGTFANYGNRFSSEMQ